MLILGSGAAWSQTSKPKVVVNFKNNSLLPHKYTFIAYAPSETGNSTHIKYVLPSSTVSFRFEEGTKMFLANAPQVDTVMAGQRIKARPFYVYSKKDQNKTINLQ